jgi:hypothetical protein
VRRFELQLILPERRHGFRLSVAPPGPEAMDAALCLCQSMLPAGTSIEPAAFGDLRLTAGRGHEAELDELLHRMSQRARRVGLSLTWAKATQPLPAGDRLVPA